MNRQRKKNLRSGMIPALCVGLFALAAELLTPTAVFADGSGPLDPFPITGAYAAYHRADRDHISIIEIAGNYNRNLDTGQPNAEPRAVIAREFFRTHPDEYDFIVAFSAFEFDTGEALAFHWAVQNKVQGIGIREFDITDLFGSQGRLQGFIDMAALTRYTADPLHPAFETVLSVLGHEMLHQWGIQVKFKLPDGTLSDALLGKDGAHWSYLLDSNASVAYGADWRDNGDGSYTAVGIRKFFSPLDLYLMGIYKPEDVPPFFLIENPGIDRTQLPQENVTVSGEKRLITINDIIAAEGPRVPAVGQAQKDFRMAFIFLVGPGQEVTDAQIAALNHIRKAYMTRFAIMTGGRAAAQVFPEALPVEQPGTPDMVGGGAIRTTPVSIDEALGWLRSKQAPEGHWTDKETTRLRDTTSVLGLLAQLDPQFANAAAALQWLSQNGSANTDSLARYAAVVAELSGSPSATRATLLGLQNTDGGWGIAAGFRSNPLDTALAVLALVGGDSKPAVDKAGQYLLASQNVDGGWGGSVGSPSRSTVTATVLKALKAAGLHATSAPPALAWLTGKQNADGGFGDSPSTVHDTAHALLTFMAFDAMGLIRADDAAEYLLSRQTVEGSWDGSVYATAIAVAALKRFSFPNWAVVSVAAEPVTVNDGDRVKLVITVRNDANVAAPVGVLRLYDGDPTQGGAPIGPDITVPTMGPGTEFLFTQFWDSFDKPGSHTLYAVVDPDGTQTEMSERDNRGSAAVTVMPAPAGVDLALADPDVLIVPVQPNALPTALGITVKVRNLGLTDAQDARIVLRTGEAGGTIVGETTLDVLARSSVVATFPFLLMQPGTTLFTVQADPDNLLAEVNETNNRASASVTTAPSVDLVVTAADIVIDKDPAYLGSDVNFTITLHNRGTLDTPTTQVRYLVTDGSVTRELRTNTIQINAGQSIEQTIPWRVDLTGNLTFTVELDPAGTVPETDETNNVASLSFSAGTPSGPNLAVSYQDFLVNPLPALEGRDLVLSALVRNTGVAAAANVEVGFYNGDPAVGGTLIGTTVVPIIEAGASASAVVVWNPVPTPGEKLLFVVADPANVIAEFMEDDNAAFNVVPVLSLPDLAITAGDIVLSPAFPKTGDAVEITVRVTNLGEQAADAVMVRVFDGDPASGGVQIGADQTIARIAGNDVGIATFAWTAAASGGTGVISTQVDPENTVLERFKTNNSARRSIAIQDGDFFASNLYFSPDGDGVKDTTELFFRLAAASDVTVEVVNRRDKVVRRLLGTELVNVSEGSVVWDGLDDLGRVVPDGRYVLRVVDGAGAALGEVIVNLDTNRSSLLESVGTKFGAFTNLTCELPSISQLVLTEDDETAFFYINSGSSSQVAYPKGVYRMEGDGTDIRAIVGEAFFTTTNEQPKYWYPPYSSYISYLAAAGNGSRVAMVRYDNWTSQDRFWVVDGDGRNLKRLNPKPRGPIWMSPDGTTVYGVVWDDTTGTSLVAVPTDGVSPARTLFTGYIDGWSMQFTRDRRKVAFTVYPDLFILDTATGVAVKPLGDNAGWVNEFAWSPNGRRLAVVDSDNGRVAVFDAGGGLVRMVAPPLPVPSNSRLNLGRLAWASSSAEFAFAANPSFEGPPPSDGSEIDPGGVYVADLTTGEVQKVVSFQFDVCYECGGETYQASATAAVVVPDGTALDPYGELSWVPGERSLLYTGYGVVYALLLDENNQIKQLFTDWGSDFQFLKYSPTGRQILFNSSRSAQDPISVCYQQGWTDEWSFKSLLNLTADLRAIRSAAGGIKLQGTASDFNFESYLLEYADTAAPDLWRPVQPAANEPVVDTLFTTWVPPAPGRYFVRLTVTDLAGNVRRKVRSVSWSDTPSITDVYRTPAIISPNGDGVKDTALIHYRVLEPVHLEFNFFNAAGDRVRTMVSDHSTIGTEHEIVWDGRDDRGLTVPDGRYRMTVQNYEFFITVDATPPVTNIRLFNAYQPFFAGESGPYVTVAPGLEWDVSDANLAEWAVQKGWGANPLEWQQANPGYCPPSDTGVDCSVSLDVGLFTNLQYRVVAADEAGNSALSSTSLGDEELIVWGFGSHTLDKSCNPARPADCRIFKRLTDPLNYVHPDFPDVRPSIVAVDEDTVRFNVSETVRSRIAQVTVQFRRTTSDPWVDAPLKETLQPTRSMPTTEYFAPAADVPQHHFSVTWDISGFEGGVAYLVRLHAVDESGADYYSNPAGFLRWPLRFRGLGLPGSKLVVELLFEEAGHLLEGENAPKPGEYILWGLESISQPITELRLIIQSADDPRYAERRVLGTVAYPDGVAVYRTYDLATCTNYEGYLEAQLEPELDPVTGSRVTRTISSNLMVIRVPCLELKTEMEVVPADGCGAPPQKRVNIRFAPRSLDGTGLKLLTLSRQEPGTGIEDILFNVNKPTSVTGDDEFPYAFALDTTDLPEGAYPLSARLINVDDQEDVEPVNVLVDHTPPAVQLTYPLEGQRVCGVPRQGVDGIVRNVMAIEGLLTDAGGFHYRLEVGSGSNADTLTQFHYSRGDKVQENSFKDALGVPASARSAATLEAFHLHEKAGPLAELYDRNGDLTIRLRVVDSGGFERCETRSFFFDGLVEGMHAAVDRGLFSPNNDGLFDIVTVRYGTEEAATVNVDVHAVISDGLGGWVVTGDPLRSLVKNRLLVGGEETVEWDGRNDSGSVVPDGMYGIVVTAVDACGNVKKQARFVAVDNTPPAITIASPGVNDLVSLIVEVQGSVYDEHIQGYGVDYGVDHVPSAWLRLAAGNGNVGTAGSSALMAGWNTFGLEGPYAIRVVALDLAGNESSVLVPVTVPTATNLISYLEAVPQLFSPNNDGKRETTAIRFGLEQDSLVTLALLGQGGQIVRTLAQERAFAKGPVVLPWDGRNEAGMAVPDGDYAAGLLVARADSPLVKQEERITITVDTVPPAITMTRPAGGFVTASGGIVGSITDLHITTYSVSVTNSPQAPAWMEIDAGTTVRSAYTFGSLADYGEGEYALRVQAADEGENIAEQIIPFIVDTTPPKVGLAAPAEGSYLGARKSPANVTGTIEEKYLAGYVLEYGAGSAPPAWTQIAAGTSLPLPEVLQAWDVSTLPDGPYTLRLTATDKAGLVGEKRVGVVVDNTPPTAAITGPAAGSYVKQPLDIVGTATDANFTEFALDLAAGSDGASARWSELAKGGSAISAGTLLSWEALPPDGLYSLRLTVKDKAENTAEAIVAVTVDTHPPAKPQGLTATVQYSTNVHLTWTANTEPDVAGYAVYRDGERITQDLIPLPEYVDANVLEGRYTYTVTAWDKAGWESEHADPAVAVVDVTPPTTRIQTPSNGATVSGLLDVKGTASSVDDFKEYRLFFVPAEDQMSRQLLRRSPVPVVSDVLSQWNTVGLPEGAQFVLRLEADDINGNTGVDEVLVTIDNLPPAAPTGLVATPTGSNVQLTWNPNSEPDLYGYLVFRNDRIANVKGTLVGDLKPYAVVDTQYPDLSLPDGPYTYFIIAMDRAGNLSDPSAPATVSIDTRPPHAVIVQPVDGTEFDAPLYVLATSVDTDVAGVQIQYRAVGDATWIDLGAPDTAVPYEATLFPTVLGLGYGAYEIQAVATDAGGVVDPAPTPVTIVYRDITRPGAPLDVTNRVNGGHVELTWTANTDPDLAGYFIDRRSPEDDWLRLTPDPVANTSAVDAGLADGAYVYAVRAVDASGNESDPAETEAVIYTPLLKQPYTPTKQTTATLTGSGRGPATVSADLVNSAGTTPLATVDADGSGAFTIPDIALAQGDNTLAVRMTDAAGNVSKTASVLVAVGASPGQPTGLTAAASGYSVALTWDPNPEPDIIGYRLFRAGLALLPDTAVPDLTAVASSEWWTPASSAVDNDDYSYWAPQTSSQASAGQWLALSWPEPRIITQTVIQWWDSEYRAVDFDLEAWAGTAWVTVAEVRANTVDRNEITLATPYRTDQLRLVLRAINNPDYYYQPVRLSEIGLFYQRIEAATTFTDLSPDGNQQYTVTAINAYGFESVPSEPAQVAVGDVQAPDPVVLTAVVTGSDVALTWTASASPDVTRYLLYRDGAFIAVHTDLVNLSAIDAGRPNGTYRYVVTAVDGANNESVPSNEATATVAVAPPQVPLELIVSPVPGGGALDVAWVPAAGSSPAGYRVLRSITAGGPYTTVTEVATTTVRDEGLTNGIAYFYVVMALDTVGNASGASNEASGTPLDLIAPFVSLHYPTIPGRQYVTGQAFATVIGATEPGAAVTVSANGAFAGTVSALDTQQTDSVQIDTWWLPVVSPDGRSAVSLSTERELILHDLAAGTTRVLTTIANYDDAYPLWSPDGRQIIFIEFDSYYYEYYVRAFRLDDRTLSNLTEPADGSAYVSVPSPDGQKLAVLRDNGIASVDLETREITLLVPVSLWQIEPLSLRWSPAGDQIAYLRTNPGNTIEVVHVGTGAVQIIESEAGYSAPSWSPDGSALLYTSRRDNTEQVWLSSLTDGTAAALTSSATGEHVDPVWSADGRAIFYLTDWFALTRLDLATGATQTLASASNYITGFSLQSLPSGHVAALFDEQTLSRFTPAGRFELQGLRLVPGDNVISAVARDAAGNIGAPSEAIVVTYDTAGLPDLSVSLSDLRVLPALPVIGEAARVTLTVRNQGQISSPQAVLSLIAIDPQGNGTMLAQGPLLNPIAPGGSQTIGADWTVPGDPGDYNLVAVVDPLDEVREVSEANNVVVRTLRIAGLAQPQVRVVNDRTAYEADQTLFASMTVENAGGPFSGRLEVAIEDRDGYLVAGILNKEVRDLAYAAQINESATWNTGRTFAGAYQTHARLFDISNHLVAEATAPFTLGTVRTFSSTAATDRAVYTANADVTVTAAATYELGNAVVSGAEAVVRITDAGGAVLAERREMLGDLLPAAVSTLTLAWNTGTHAVGPYRVALEVAAAGEVLTSAEALFTLEAGSAQLSGTLALSEQAPAPGTPQIATFTVQNKGNAALIQLPVFVSLIDPDQQSILARFPFMVDLPVAGGTTGSATFDTTGLALKNYTVLLQAEVSDPSGPRLVTLQSAGFPVVDRTPPLVGLRAPIEGGYIRGDGTAMVFARDLLSSIKQVEISVDSGPWLLTPVRDAAEGLYGDLLRNLVEGAHTIAARATDAYSNVGATGVLSFIVDNTPPAISFANVADGAYYNALVSPQVIVSDLNLDQQYVTLNGAAFLSGTPVSVEDSYWLTALAIDKAGNRTEADVRFTLDFTPPVVLVAGVEDGRFYNSDVTPVITVSDANLKGSTATLNGAAFTSGTAITAEGSYLLVVRAEDLAGNVTTVERTFTIDKTPPQVVVTSPLDGVVLNEYRVDVLGTTEPFSTVSLVLAGQTYSVLSDEQGRFLFIQVALVDGPNTFSVSAKDRAGNVGAPVTLTVTVAVSATELKGKILPARSVLAWVPCAVDHVYDDHDGHDQYKDHDKSHGKDYDKHADRVHDKNHGKGHDNDRRHDAPTDAASRLEELIEATLAERGVDYHVVHTEKDFITALRTQQYGTMLIGELKPDGDACKDEDDHHDKDGKRSSRSAHDHEDGKNSCPGASSFKLSKESLREVRAMVASGANLVWIKTDPDNDEHWADLFGAKPQGIIPKLEGVELTDSPASHAGTWETIGPGLRLTLRGGTAVGRLMPKGEYPAMVINTYGQGKTALVAFDPARFRDQAGARTVLADVVAFATPAEARLIPGGVVEVQWTASRLQPSLSARLKANLPFGFEYVRVLGGTANGLEATWEQTVETTESVFRALVRLPADAGDYTMAARLFKVEGSFTSLLAESELSVTISPNRAALGDELVAAVARLTTSSKKDRKTIQSAIYHLNKALARPQNSADDADYAIERLLAAIELLRSCKTIPAGEIRVIESQISVLLRIYQALWSGFTSR